MWARLHSARFSPTDTPSNLQVNYQRSPAYGVGPTLRLSWQVPAEHAPDGTQSSYRIVVSDKATGHLAWDSGTVDSSDSINVHLDARRAGLRPGTAYTWTVACGPSDASLPAEFVTGLWDGFDPAAKWIWAKDTNQSQHFAFLRHDLQLPPGKEVRTALLFATAWVEPTMMAAFKFYIDSELVALGPGRGEARVLDRNATFLHAPYVTADVTGRVRHGAALAVRGMAPLFQTPCLLHACNDYNTAGGGVLAQLVVAFADGTSLTVATGRDEWAAFP
eukprot:gene6048-5913_t